MKSILLVVPSEAYATGGNRPNYPDIGHFCQTSSGVVIDIMRDEVVHPGADYTLLGHFNILALTVQILQKGILTISMKHPCIDTFLKGS